MILHKLVTGFHLTALFLWSSIRVGLGALRRRPRRALLEFRQTVVIAWLGIHAWLVLRGKFRVTRLVRLCLLNGVARSTLERNLEAATALAEWDIGRQKFERAVQLLSSHIDSAPQHPKTAKCLGLRSLAHMWRGNQNDGVEDLSRCVELRPAFARGFNYLANLAQIRGMRGEVEQARAAMALQCEAPSEADPTEFLAKFLKKRTAHHIASTPTDQTIGAMFGAYHNAIGHAILDPFHFYNLFRHRFDHLVVFHPDIFHYSRSASLMIEVMRQYVDQIGVEAKKLGQIPWQNLGEIPAGHVTFLCHNYWSLNRMAYHARMDPKHPMSLGRRYVSLPPKILDRAEAVCRKNRLDISRPVVVLHARAHGYHKLQVQSFRNVDVKNYIPAVRRLIDLGYCVVRIGDHASESIRDHVPELIELPWLEHYDCALDLYFLSRCRFMISCQSGPCSLARALGKPNLVANAVYHHTMLPEVNELFLFKEYRDAGGHPLPLEEILTRGCHLFDRSSHFEDAGIHLREATPDELLAAVDEMVGVLDLPNRRDTAHQAAFRELMFRFAEKGTSRYTTAGNMADYIGYALPEGRVSDAVSRMRSGYVTLDRRAA
jgi:putative glycosyltransferase (TIGR04372 family)